MQKIILLSVLFYGGLISLPLFLDPNPIKMDFSDIVVQEETQVEFTSFKSSVNKTYDNENPNNRHEPQFNNTEVLLPLNVVDESSLDPDMFHEHKL